MQTAFPLTEIDRVMRRTVISAIGAGVAGAAGAILLGYPLVVPGLAIGLCLALANHRVFQTSALRFTSPEGVVNRKPFAGSVALRLGVCTGVAIALLVIKEPVGWGVVGGLALFQAALLANALVSLMQYQRQDAAAAAAAAAGDQDD